MTVVDPSQSTHTYLHDLELKIASFETYIEEDYFDEVITFFLNVDKTLKVEPFVYLKYFAGFNDLPKDFQLEDRVW